MTTPPLTPEEYDQAAGTTPPLGLPPTPTPVRCLTYVNGNQQTNLEVCRTTDPNRIAVAITQWQTGTDGTAEHVSYVTFHWDVFVDMFARACVLYGAPTEGGHPTTPPTGLRAHDGSDTK